MICCALMACKRNSVEFTYSPTAPKAGQTVSFANLSASGEDWSWSFGDGATSASKAPTHVYKQPGTYHVTLTVDNNKSWRAAHDITVYDTVPSFSCKDSVFVIFKNYTFVANVYNPYNYKIQYLWSLPVSGPDAEPAIEPADPDASWEKASMSFYFTAPDDEAAIALRVIINGDTVNIERKFKVLDRKAHAILFRTPAGDFSQRIFGDRAERYNPLTDGTLLDKEQDSVQTYNDSTFVLKNLTANFPGITGFRIANRKIYYRADGLWVANIDGANKVQIDPSECAAMTLDTIDSRIYWANGNGVWYMPFVGADNNKFVTVPAQLNSFTDVTKIAADAELK